jgi:putative zinc finger protein
LSGRSELSDERLRIAFQAPAADPAPAGSTCPSAADLWGALRAELPEDERRAVVDHVAACPSCAEAWRLGMALSPEVIPAAATAVPARRAVFGGRPAFASLAAAAAVVLALGGLWLWRAPQPAAPGFRGASGAVRSLLEEGEALPREDCRLRWSAGPAGSRYDLRVTTESLQLVATAQGLSEPSYRVPEAALSALPPGSRLLWRVEVVLPDGSREDSPTFVGVLR